MWGVLVFAVLDNFSCSILVSSISIAVLQYCGILQTCGMQFFSLLDYIKNFPPYPSPFFEPSTVSFCFWTGWDWLLQLTFSNKFFILISKLFAFNITYRIGVSALCNIVIVAKFFLQYHCVQNHPMTSSLMYHHFSK